MPNSFDDEVKALAETYVNPSGNALRGIEKGPSDGTLELKLAHPNSSRRSQIIHVIVTNFEQYPTGHTAYAYSDDDLDDDLTEALERFAERKGVPIHQIVSQVVKAVCKISLESSLSASSSKLMKRISSNVDMRDARNNGEEVLADDEDGPEDDDDDDGEGEDDYGDTIDDSDDEKAYENDEIFGLGEISSQPDAEMLNILKRDFIQIVEAGYRPGFTRVSELDNVVSIAAEINYLKIDPRALEAWDPKLLPTSNVPFKLVLLINFGGRCPIRLDDLNRSSARFAIGLSRKYKPSRDAIGNAFRTHSAMTSYTEGEFEAFSLSSPLLSLFSDKFMEVLLYRRQHSSPGLNAPQRSNSSASVGKALESNPHKKLKVGHATIKAVRRKADGCGWAGAEAVVLRNDKMTGGDHVTKVQKEADAHEEANDGTYYLPEDPLADEETRGNFPLIAFAYLLRRFVMCPSFCLICHRRIQSGLIALKPYVCSDPLCTFQYFSIGLGPSVEYEIISNTSAVDLLIQLAYVSARENEMREHPTGLGLRFSTSSAPPFSTTVVALPSLASSTNPAVPTPQATSTPTDQHVSAQADLIEFDSLRDESDPDRGKRNRAIASLIQELPTVREASLQLSRTSRGRRIGADDTLQMKAWLTGEGLTIDEQKMYRNRRLKDMKNGKINPSAFDLLRWIVASNTSYLVEIKQSDERIQNIPTTYRQFRFVVGSPDKEDRLAKAIRQNQQKNANAVTYPTLFGFHGSPIKNWHSILREGLHFKKTTHGRAYGHGCYFAKQGETSMDHYAQPSSSGWKNAAAVISRVTALCEIVNDPSSFVHTEPYYVVQNLDWIQTRYLLVAQHEKLTLTQGVQPGNQPPPPKLWGGTEVRTPEESPMPLAFKPIDPKNILTLQAKAIEIPDVEAKVQKLVASAGSNTNEDEYSPSDDELISGGRRLRKKPVEHWKPDTAELKKRIVLLPSPKQASPMAATTLQREIKAVMQAQEVEGIDLGFYLDPELTGDNLFHWIVEMFNFDEDLPLHKDMQAENIPSIIFEIQFPQDFPHGPPFIRVVYPRFLDFASGGGGHITVGGSICMEVLTLSGWTAGRSIESILMEIRALLCETERPARLDSRYKGTPYSVSEALDAFKRAANKYGWKVPDETLRSVKGR